ncbi:helitron_like_N domain-containing protein [Trichonephila clavipes]|nr:helitron_like_N domain-containing protein [Trichonephila clavipes]
MERCENSKCNPELMRSIDEVIRQGNLFTATYTMMWELEQHVLREEGYEASENVTLYISDDRLDSDQHRGKYNAPKQKRLQWRDIFNPILYGSKLMQQYAVDSYVKVEGNRLNFIRYNQRTMRVELYLGLDDHVNALATESGMRAGVTLILPSSFIGSPRAKQQNFQDIMSILPEFSTSKRKHFYKHLLLVLAEEDKIRDPESIGLIVSAELPDKTVDPKLHKIAKSTITHGPCGVLNPNAPCIVDGFRTKVYPEKFGDTTAENIDGYAMYSRSDNTNHVVINGNVIDNRWIVPYNPYLTKKYNAHIDVEICSSIKYIFKYVYKGHNCAKDVFEDSSQTFMTRQYRPF